MANYPEINGREVSYASIELDVDGDIYPLIKAINYKEAGEAPKVRGTGRKPQGRTIGYSDPSGDIEIYRKDWKRLLKKLTGDGAYGFMERSHTISVTYSEESDPENTTTDKLAGVVFMSPDSSNAESSDASTLKLELSIMEIEWDSKYVSLSRPK